MKARPSNLTRSLAVVSLLLGACADSAASSDGTFDPPSTTPPSESHSTPDTPSPSVATLPRSKQADRCVKDQWKWVGQWNAAMDLASMSRDHETGLLTEAEDREVREQVLEAANGLIVNAAAMEEALEDEGPVRNGDQCLMAAATSLALLSGFGNYEGPQTPDNAKQAKRFFEAVLRYYPGTRSADEAQDGLDNCHESRPTCYPDYG